ncbi:S-adenosyl-L-methionine-dependent methyltransferase [Xylaria sp. FL0064]|nr:S-adenosyl-L-methionine-dependent methyltransferase [Xylaria sp. FL0064]
MASKTDYVFTRDFLDINRINLMHFLWTKLFGFAMDPKIPTEAANLRVADIGTGTGIWLLDIQSSLKDAQLDGLDISFEAAPPKETLPTGVTFRHWDVREEVPEDLKGVYDIINVRFFAFVLLNDEIPRVVAKLFSLLKAGGYLQWGEPDLETLRFDTTKPEAKTDNVREFFSLLAVQDPRLKPTWINHLEEIFTNSGFVEVERVIRDAVPHLAYTFHEVGLMIHEQIARKTKNKYMAGALKRLLPAAVEETRLGAYITSLRYVVVGKKG